MKNITLSSNYNFVSGYGELLDVLLKDLSSLGYNVLPRTYSTILPKYVHYFDNNFEINSQVDLCLLSIVNEIGNINPLLHINFDRPRILYTMWESTRINDLIIEILNKFKCIIVPSNYNKINLLKQGCNTRIEVVPLFCNTDFFSYKPNNIKEKFVFGISNEDPRKNIEKVQNCFAKAFKNFIDVELQIKICNKSHRELFSSKIRTINKKYTIDELRDWYYNLNVYISGSTCEGWGMMQQESMCCGRPIIFTNYGGLSEYSNKNNGFEINHKEVFAKCLWGDSGGKWSEFDEHDMIEKMLYCYNHREEVIEKGKLAARDASQFTKQRFLKKIDEIITEYL